MDEIKALAKLDEESDQAYQAFLDYVQMGAGRSLNKLLAQYQQTQTANKSLTVPTTRKMTLADWSRNHRWQERLANYMGEMSALIVAEQKELYEGFSRQALGQSLRLSSMIEEMMAEFKRLKVTRKGYVKDPRDADKPEGEQRLIESVTYKVNVGDLVQLANAHGNLWKNTRAGLGMPTVTELTGTVTNQMKAYIGFDPGAWDAEQPSTEETTEEKADE